MRLIVCIFLILANLDVDADEWSKKQPLAINVAATFWPPFLNEEGVGMGAEVLDALNSIQTKFDFKLVPIPVKRRVQAIELGRADIIMWDNINWGWPKSRFEASLPLLESKDVFITYNKNTNVYQLERERICIVRGYHYKFLDYSTDTAKIDDMYDVIMVRTENETIKMAILNRCEVSLASTSALNWYFKQNPNSKGTVIVTDRVDTEYTRHFLVPKNAPISVNEINELIKKANALGLLKPIYEKYGQEIPELVYQ